MHKQQVLLAILVILLVVGCNPQPLPIEPTPIPTLPPATLPSEGSETSPAAPSMGEQEQAEGVSAPADRAEEGRQISQETGCLSCHSVDGTNLVGPTFQGLVGHERTFEDGTVATADGSYIRSSILKPGDQIVQGYANVMPAIYEQQLSDDQIDAIIAFIESLDLLNK
jgi:mono/diheme cytochrome c family protein